MLRDLSSRVSAARQAVPVAVFLAATLLIAAALTRRSIACAGHVDPKASQASRTAAVLDIAILVFREGLECILVLAAITASLTGSEEWYQRPVTVGAGIAFAQLLSLGASPEASFRRASAKCST